MKEMILLFINSDIKYVSRSVTSKFILPTLGEYVDEEISLDDDVDKLFDSIIELILWDATAGEEAILTK